MFFSYLTPLGVQADAEHPLCSVLAYFVVFSFLLEGF